jgi:hypothetical protein
MSHISPVGSFGSSNWLQGLGSTANSSASSGVNAGSGTTITEDSFAIVDINFSGISLSDGSPTSSSPNSSSGANSSGTSTTGTSNSGTSSSGSSLFANLLNQIDTALQDVLQALGGNTTGAQAASGGTGTASTGATGTGATGAGSTSSAGPSNTTTSNTTPSNTTPANTTGATDQTESDSDTPATSGSTSDITITAISIESVEVTTDGASPATTTPTTTGTASNSTGNTNSSNNDLQLLQQVFSALSNVFQQNGIGSSQTSSASQSPLASFLGQNGLTPDQFSQGLFSSLQQNGGTGFSLAQVFQNAPSGQNLNLLA